MGQKHDSYSESALFKRCWGSSIGLPAENEIQVFNWHANFPGCHRLRRLLDAAPKDRCGWAYILRVQGLRSNSAQYAEWFLGLLGDANYRRGERSKTYEYKALERRGFAEPYLGSYAIPAT
jgi:hypothetical protein